MIKCGKTSDITFARIHEFGKFLKLALVRCVGNPPTCLFVEAYKNAVSQNLWNSVPPTFECNLRNIVIEVQQIDSLDALYMDNKIQKTLHYSFQKKDLKGDENLQLVTLGWKHPAGKIVMKTYN